MAGWEFGSGRMGGWEVGGWEVGGQKLEVGGWREVVGLELGRLEIEGWVWEVGRLGRWRPSTGGWTLGAGCWVLVTGGRVLEVADWRWATKGLEVGRSEGWWVGGHRLGAGDGNC